MLTVLFRIAGSLAGGVMMFALWLVAVLIRMPRPPVPPSFAVTITAPVLVATGFALGSHVVERVTRRRQGEARAVFAWTLGGGMAGTVVMYPFGGMMAGFGLLGFGTAALIAREVRAVLAAKRAPAA